MCIKRQTIRTWTLMADMKTAYVKYYVKNQQNEKTNEKAL